jgi:mercuric ion binding protein
MAAAFQTNSTIMKILRIILPALLLTFLATAAQAQKATLTETFKVLGNCGMCQKTIQTAALDAGAKSAVWDMDAHTLTVTFKEKKTSVDAIQKAIAAKGYDTPLHKAEDAVYNNLHGCCQYDRSESLVQ